MIDLSDLAITMMTIKSILTTPATYIVHQIDIYYKQLAVVL